ncbi:MAG: 3-demethylubiquinone-9 3-methyltransferase [Paenibacillus sp.]|jgi:predicted 3-demethylubiquinone-9 3-methyltransferase (glyoxalase superfamily)|nr:3-demethylubiquinone-9 3-methyltransferase [Paenibacillus sp.]
MTAGKVGKISTNLWFDNQAEEAARYYTALFPNSGIERITRYGKERKELGGLEEGAVMTVEFRLDGQPFVALNGGPRYRFNESISYIVHCDSQEELDHYWDRLSEGGDEQAQICGWLKDKFGVSWQVVPANLTDMLQDSDPAKADRVMKALLKTATKIDMGALRRAYDGENP